jgi:hypothetical protein
MLIDAHSNPGPAMWQGLMLLVLAIWMVWQGYGETKTSKQMKISVVIIAVVGITLFVVINVWL